MCFLFFLSKYTLGMNVCRNTLHGVSVGNWKIRRTTWIFLRVKKSHSASKLKRKLKLNCKVENDGYATYWYLSFIWLNFDVDWYHWHPLTRDAFKRHERVPLIAGFSCLLKRCREIPQPTRIELKASIGGADSLVR